MSSEAAVSSREAFAKFNTWKTSRTVMKLTIVTKGELPEMLRGEISSLDEKLDLVGFGPTTVHPYKIFDFSAAIFQVGTRVVEAECGEDYLMFEEAAVASP
jgi:hypothetical protein